MKVLEGRIRTHASQLKGPKVIFIGGSSTLMAIDAPRYSRELGRPVLNYGLSAALPLEEIAARAVDFVGRGDLVVMAPEHLYFQRSAKPVPMTNSPSHRLSFDLTSLSFFWAIWRAEGRSAALLGHLDHQTRRLMRQEIFGYRLPFRAQQPVISDNIYWASNLTPTGHLQLDRPKRISDDLYGKFRGFEFDPVKGVDPAESTGGRAFELLRKVCSERKATLAAMPPARLSDPADPFNRVTDIEKRWLEDVRSQGEIIVLEAGESTLDREYAFDSYYHLNNAGVEIFSQKLLPRLKQILANLPSGTNSSKDLR